MEAGHACRMERISDEKLFYLRSRGVGRENALRIMLEAKIKDLFKNLQDFDEAFYNEILELCIEKI
jgi:Fe-S cluster assembly scaffold protein SufB